MRSFTIEPRLRPGRVLGVWLLVLLVGGAWQAAGADPDLLRAHDHEPWQGVRPILPLPGAERRQGALPGRGSRIIARARGAEALRMRELRQPAPDSHRPAYRSRWLYVGAALGTSAALLAWWSEERADAAYRKYLHAAGLRRQRRAFQLARRYDRATGAAFVGMHAGVGLVAYVLLFQSHD